MVGHFPNDKKLKKRTQDQELHEVGEVFFPLRKIREQSKTLLKNLVSHSPSKKEISEQGQMQKKKELGEKQ